MKIAINGAGIAGPTLAYWLRKGGHEVLLVEQSPQLRREGYVIDFWGVGYDIAEKMGVLPAILSQGYQMREVRFVDAHDRKVGGFAAEVFWRATTGRFTSVRRSDLAAIIFGALDAEVETLFGDSIRTLHNEPDGMRIGFDHAAERVVDLVIGADGLHSRIRRLAFNCDPECVLSLGYHVAAFEAEGYTPRDELVFVTHGIPGRQVSRMAMRDDKTLFLIVFRDDYMTGPAPASDVGRMALIRTVFAGVGGEWQRVLDIMEDTKELYFDSVSQIRMDRWSNGRTALIGDAGACVSLLAGEGTGLAMAEAYALASELNTCAGNYARAFSRFEARMMPFIARKQRAAAKFASAFAPRTALGLTFRNLVTRVLDVPAIADFFIGRDLRDDVELPALEGVKRGAS